MTDNDLIRLFLPIIKTGLVADGYLDVVVKQANQPTQQGVDLRPSVFFYKVSDKRYGFLGRQAVWNSTSSQMDHTETQFYETTFQVSALVLQNPRNTTSYTASDLVNEVASIMQSDRARSILMAVEVGILRVQDVINPYFVDDRENFEASPSFDFTLTYKQTRVTLDPVIQSIEYDINRV